MSATDPRAELQEMLRLYKRCDLSEAGGTWARTTLEAVDPIMRYVEYLRLNGYPIPDDVLREGFKRIYDHARAWIVDVAEAELRFRWEQENDYRFGSSDN